MFPPKGEVTVNEPLSLLQTGCVVFATGKAGIDGGGLITTKTGKEIQLVVVFFTVKL